MAVSTEISLYDHVELLTAIDEAPVGSRGGVLDFFEDGKVAMVEVLEPALDGLDCIVVAPVSQLRRIDAQ
jgi:hypothetical protein